MKFEKVISKEWPMCYVATSLRLGNEVYAAFASESHDTTGAVLVDASLEIHPLWDTPGGCMGIVQIPGLDEFLTIQRFYPIFVSEKAEIAWFFRENGAWTRKVLAIVPFVHRIEIARENGEYYVIICQLCKEKAFVDDWSSAGCVYAAKMDLRFRTIEEQVPVLNGLVKNHGLAKLPAENDRLLIAHNSGIHELSMGTDGIWSTLQIFDEPCSDIAISEWSTETGLAEIGVITPFHGENFQILRKESGVWKQVFSTSDAFGHGIWGGKLAGLPCYLVGYRSGTQGIYCVHAKQNSYRIEPVDMGVGNANLAVFFWNGGTCIGAANRESNTFAIYQVHA